MNATDARRTEMELKVEQKVLCGEIESKDGMLSRADEEVRCLTQVNLDLLEEKSNLAEENRMLRLQKAKQFAELARECSDLTNKNAELSKEVSELAGEAAERVNEELAFAKRLVQGIEISELKAKIVRAENEKLKTDLELALKELKIEKLKIELKGGKAANPLVDVTKDTANRL